MENKPAEIGKEIKKIRDINKLSQDRFGYKIGLSGKTISAYETGKTTPPLKIIKKITQVYHMSYLAIQEEPKAEINQRIITIESEIQKIKDIIGEGFTLYNGNLL